ncbi:MAG: serine/threonine protein kinase [Verrucomicrobia bacterium]|nr:serine/threonine protein kinase [Verrucomicrobiota bacterium]
MSSKGREQRVGDNSFEITDIAIVASLLERLEALARTQLGAQNLRDMVGAVKLITDLSPVLGRMGEDVHGQIGPKASALRVEHDYREWKLRLGRMLAICSGAGEATASLKHLSDQAGEILVSLRRLQDQCRAAEEEQLAQAQLEGHCSEISKLLADGILSGWQPLWARANRTGKEDLALMGKFGSLRQGITAFAQIWESSLDCGRALAETYGRHDSWPLRSRKQEETSSAWLLDTLRAVRHWGERQLARMQKLKPSELPAVPLNLDFGLAAPVAQLALEIEVGLAPLRAMVVGPVMAIEGIRALREKAKFDGYLPQQGSRDCVLRLLVDCKLDADFLAALCAVAVILDGEEKAVDVGRDAIVLLIGATMPRYLRGPQFTSENTNQAAYGTLKRSVLAPSTDLAFGLRVWAKHPDWPMTLRQGLQSTIWQRLPEMGALGWWVLASLLDSVPSEDTGAAARLMQQARIANASLEALVPLVGMQSIDLSDDVLCLLSSLEALALQRHSDIELRAMPTFIQRFGGQYPVLCNRLRTKFVARNTAARSPPGSAASTPMADDDLVQQVHQMVRARNYRGVRCLEKLSRRFVEECAQPFLSSVESATERKEIDNALSGLSGSDPEQIIEQWGREFPHGPEGKLRLRLINDCREMLEAIHKLGEMALRNLGASRTDPQALQRELKELHRLGEMGGQGADLMTQVLKGDVSSVVLPGNALSNTALLWCFPRSLTLWNSGCFDLARYREAFEKDLAEDPRDFALSEANAGRVGWAENVIGELGVPVTDEKRRAILETARDWVELLDLARSEILADLGDEAKSDEVRALLAWHSEALVQRNYVEAERALESLREPANECRKRKQEAQIIRENLDQEIERLLLAVSRAKLSVDMKSEWLRRMLMLQDKLSGGVDILTIHREKEVLAARLAAGDAPPQEPVMAAACPSAGETKSEKLSVPQIQQREGPYYGIVKAVLGMYGFIVPFDNVLYSGEDIFFHKNHVRPRTDGASDLPPAGILVGFPGVTRRPEHPRPGVSDVWLLSPGEQATAIAKLSESLGMPLEDVGWFNGQALLTVGCGFRSVAEPREAENGSLLCFQAVPTSQPEAAVKLLGPPSRVTEKGMEFFRRLARRARPPERPRAITGSPLTPESLQSLQTLDPSQPNSYRDAKEWQVHLNTSEDHERVVEALVKLPTYGANAANMAWLRAVLIKSFLTKAKAAKEPVQDVLNGLVQSAPVWFGPNQDATFSLLYQGMHAFAEESPQEFSHDDMWRFFSKLQDRLGTRPHYRLELIMANISIEEAEDGVPDETKIVERAADHARRAMVIHPRLSESHNLLRQLETRFGWRQPREKPPISPHSGPIAPEQATSADDPVDETERIRQFYDGLGGRSNAEKANRFFHARRERVREGLPLDELLASHCRYLLTCERPAEAEALILDEARQGHIADWAMVVRLLSDAWRALGLDEAKIRDSVARLRATLPPTVQPHFELLLASLLFDKGRYESALRHAEQARDALPSAETRHLVSRCEQQIARAGKPVVPTDQAREEAWTKVQRIAAEEDAASVTAFVVDRMSDERVGPWLVRECVSDSSVLSQDGERRALIRQARSWEKAPSVELLQAYLRVHHASVSQQVARLDGAVLEAAVRDPQLAVIESIDRTLTDAAAAFALYDSLREIHPSVLDIRWRLAMAAKKLWSESKDHKYMDKHVLASLLCVWTRGSRFAPAVVVNDMLSMGLFGLAAVVAHSAAQGGQKGLEDILRLAVGKATPSPWEWPSVLQRARMELDERRWGAAENSVICALLACPSHWPTCQTFRRVFTDPMEEDLLVLKAVSGMALSGVNLALSTSEGRDSPELLVLKAELTLHSAEIGEVPAAADEAARVCSDLCSQAQRQRQGFKPAILLQNRLKPGLSLAPGETYAGCYCIVEALSPGSYGQVYRAKVLDPGSGEPNTVALKFVRADAPTPERKEQQRSALAREAKIALRLKHPAIVSVFDFLNNQCLVMEYIDGWTVASKIEHSIRLPWQTVHQIGLQIAEALEYATDLVRREFGTEDSHTTAREFAHRDIHPGNIMVTDRDGRPHAKLLDFGLARVPGGTATTAVFAGVNRRLAYRAPDYGPRMDHRGDMFALGVILYELIAGEGPYPYDRYCDFQNNQAKSEDAPCKLRRIGDLLGTGVDVPDAFATVLARMVAFKCTDRHDNWASLIRDLREAVTETGKASA